MDKKVLWGIVLGIAGAALVAPKVAALLSLDDEENTWQKMDDNVDANQAEGEVNGSMRADLENERQETESTDFFKGQDI